MTRYARITRALRYNLSRLLKFFGIFLRNRRGFIGLSLILLSTVVAFFPSIFTPYDPVLSRSLSGYYSAPAWLRYVPSEIGGMPTLTENLAPIINADFQNSTLVPWNWTFGPGCSVQYKDDVGNHSGILHLAFSREETGEAYGSVSACVSQEFYFPYSGPPWSFRGRIIFSLNGSSTIITRTVTYVNESNPFQWPKPTRNETFELIDVPTKVEVFFEALAINQSFPVWPLRQYYQYTPIELQGMAMDGTYVEAPRQWVDSSGGVEPIDSFSRLIAQMLNDTRGRSGLANYVFFPFEACPGTFRIGINVTFVDANVAKPVHVDVYLDSLQFSIFGSGWGIMGTDSEGRDLFSQLVYGARISLYVGVLSSVLAVVLGLSMGLIAGYVGKAVDEFIMRLCDVLLVLPGLPLLIVLIAVLGATIDNLIILLGVLGWMGFARLVRSQVISLKERPFIEAAKAVGAGKVHIMFRHILPNVMSLVYVTLATTVPGNIVAEASLGFLGFSDPNRMSWGRMLNEMALHNAYRNWWWVIPPGLCIAAIALAFVLLGFALDEVLNPRIRLRR